jgi:hypothetical protein
MDHDGPHQTNLLVIYYCGYGVLLDEGDGTELYISGYVTSIRLYNKSVDLIQRRTRDRSLQEVLWEPMCSWKSADIHLRHAEADVLTIMDICYAHTTSVAKSSGTSDAHFVCSDHGRATRSFEVIAAPQGGRVGFTEPSFTRALIESLIELQNESGWLDTSRLHSRAMDRMRPLVNIPRLYNRIGSRNTRHIRLAPLPKTVHQKLPQAERAASMIRLEIVFAEYFELSRKEITLLATSLATAVKVADLDITELNWVFFDPYPLGDEYREVSGAESIAGVLRLQVGFATHRSLTEDETRRLKTGVANAVSVTNRDIVALDYGPLEPCPTGTEVLKSWVSRWRLRKVQAESNRHEIQLQMQDQRKESGQSADISRRLTPSRSFTDRFDLANTDRSSSVGNESSGSRSPSTGPGMYSTSKPLRGSTGYSSIDDDNSRLLSSVTGPETHEMTPREKDGIEEDCADDEHVSDTDSIYTDGRAHDLPPETEHSLANDFANHIVENLTADKLKDLFSQHEQDALVLIEDLVRDFAILLDVSVAGIAVHQQAVTFVRHKRRIIARCLASAATAWRPSTEGQVSIGEKMRLLHFDDADPSQYEDPNAERRFVEPDEDTDRLDELHLPNDNIPELRDVVLAKGFLLNSDELPWMIDRIRRMESFSNTGNTWASVRGQIARVIESSDQQIDLTLHWDVLETLHEQYDRDESRLARLSDMIVYNGTASMCYASTTSEYAEQVWPALGKSIVATFDRAVVSADHVSIIALHKSRLQISLNGTITDIRLEATTERSDSQSRIQMLEVSIWASDHAQRYAKTQ